MVLMIGDGGDGGDCRGGGVAAADADERRISV